jgi:hypothetical protein
MQPRIPATLRSQARSQPRRPTIRSNRAARIRQQGLRTMKHLRDRQSTHVANVSINSAAVEKTEALAEADYPPPARRPIRFISWSGSVRGRL